MTNLSPPDELVDQWINDGPPLDQPKFVAHYVATQAAQWAADQELQACINFIYDNELCDPNFYKDLRNHRRPKPPTLKEQALRVLVENGTNLDGRMELDSADIEIISRALEALPND
jgi:hypothetical protein